jgi:hypothetical protein
MSDKPDTPVFLCERCFLVMKDNESLIPEEWEGGI